MLALVTITALGSNTNQTFAKVRNKLAGAGPAHGGLPLRRGGGYNPPSVAPPRPGGVHLRRGQRCPRRGRQGACSEIPRRSGRPPGDFRCAGRRGDSRHIKAAPCIAAPRDTWSAGYRFPFHWPIRCRVARNAATLPSSSAQSLRPSCRSRSHFSTSHAKVGYRPTARPGQGIRRGSDWGSIPPIVPRAGRPGQECRSVDALQSSTRAVPRPAFLVAAPGAGTAGTLRGKAPPAFGQPPLTGLSRRLDLGARHDLRGRLLGGTGLRR
jgi:hypothetical protein